MEKGRVKTTKTSQYTPLRNEIKNKDCNHNLSKNVLILYKPKTKYYYLVLSSDKYFEFSLM